MTSCERIIHALRHEEADRVAIQDGPWSTTVARWRREGLPGNTSPAEFFNYEFVRIGADRSFRFPIKVLEETDEYRIHVDANGRTLKNWKDRTLTPMLIDYTVKTRDDWEKHKRRLTPDRSRINWDVMERTYKRARRLGKFFCYSGGAGYQASTGKIHLESMLEAMVTDPEWIKDVIDTGVHLTLGLFEMLIDEGYEFDGYWCSDDLGHRNGLMFSPREFHDLVMPAHKRLCDFCHENGIFAILHTCGNFNEVVPELIEIGWDCLQPLEVKAGMDVIELKRRYGDNVALMGGIDVRVMADGTDEELEEEIGRKITIAKENGGYIYHSDHSVPDNVSFPRYKRVIELVHKYGSYV
jgi:uroporphyrinogen decarboxylase